MRFGMRDIYILDVKARTRLTKLDEASLDKAGTAGLGAPGLGVEDADWSFAVE